MSVKSERICTNCGDKLNEEEAESPQIDEDGSVICDHCFEDQYSHRCPLCEDIFDEDFSESISPKYLLLTKYAAEELGFDPGIYEITSYPFFADGITEIHLFRTAIKKIADLPSDFNEDNLFSDICYVCEDCVKKLVISEKKEGEEEMRKEREAGYRKARLKYLQDLENLTFSQEVELKQLTKEVEKDDDIRS